MSKSTSATKLGPRRNWRDIQQGGSARRSTTGIALRRRWLSIARWFGGALLAFLLFGGAAYGVYSATQMGASNVEQKVVAKMTFRTDGVLTTAWLQNVCEVRPGSPMDAVDIHRIKASLERYGQVRQVTVTRKLPDELIVEVRERAPVLRARVAMKDGQTKTVLIARDGTVYEGSNYPAETIRALPYLGGVAFKRSDHGIVPLKGMETVAELLDTVRQAWPQIYGGWKVVSFDRYTGDPDAPGSVIKVNSRHVGEIVFAPHGFGRQVENLARILEHSAAGPVREIHKVDLSLQEQVVVQYQGPGRGPRR